MLRAFVVLSLGNGGGHSGSETSTVTDPAGETRDVTFTRRRVNSLRNNIEEEKTAGTPRCSGSRFVEFSFKLENASETEIGLKEVVNEVITSFTEERD